MPRNHVKSAAIGKCERCGKIIYARKARKRFCSMGCYRPTLLIQDRLLANLYIDPKGCWVWTGWKDRDGYGAFSLYDRTKKTLKYTRVNRAVYELFHGPIKKGLMVCHHCDNPVCFRPSHLFQGTAWDNNHDMIKKGRCNPPRGERAGGAVLTENDVRMIRSMHTSGEYTQRQIAKEFGVGYKAICKIVHRQRWAHVK